MKNTGILIHGLCLQAKDWRKVVWGKPPNLLGRLTRGIVVAIEEKAKIIVLGTGASQTIDGRKEAEFTKDYLLNNFLELGEFSVFKEMDLKEIQKEIEKILKLETHSKNTEEEIRFAGRILKKAGCEKIILVSCPTHISRCLKDAYKVFSRGKNFSTFAQNLFATPSQICFSGTAIEDVIIKEPPHKIMPKRD
ncbi:MAG: YdcF family protein [Patescibacteria group bacterium]|nr:YdcF family protein [Patescibacteria group bacterium]